MAETTADIGRRTYYLEVFKLIFGSTWFGWLVAAAIAAVHFGPSYVPAVTQYLPGKTEVQKVALSPSIEQLHDRVIKMEGDMRLVADWVAQQQLKIPARPAAPPAVKAKQ